MNLGDVKIAADSSLDSYYREKGVKKAIGVEGGNSNGTGNKIKFN